MQYVMYLYKKKKKKSEQQKETGISHLNILFSCQGINFHKLLGRKG